MKRIKSISILILLILLINIPICTMATSFKSGDIVEFKEATALYEKKTTSGENLAELKKTTKTGKKGKKVTYKGSVITASIRNIPSELKGKDLCAITIDGKQYIIATSKIKKASTSGGSQTTEQPKEDEDVALDHEENGSQTAIEEARKKEEEEAKKRQEQADSVYQNPQLDTSGRTAAGSLNDMIGDADSFANQGQIQYNEKALQNFSSVLFNIFSIVGTAVALIVGIIIGTKYMMGSTEEKANYKQMLVPYLVGCFVVFSAFGIWKLIITILEEV